MKIMLRLVVCAVLIAAVRCDYPSKDVRIVKRQVPDLPDWPPATESPDGPDPEGEQGVIPDWPPTTDVPEEDPADAAGDSSAWMVTAIVFIVLFVIAVGIAIYMYATLPPRYSSNNTFTLPRVNPQPSH